jgi:hypothetical protein
MHDEEEDNDNILPTTTTKDIFIHSRSITTALDSTLSMTQSTFDPLDSNHSMDEQPIKKIKLPFQPPLSRSSILPSLGIEALSQPSWQSNQHVESFEYPSKNLSGRQRRLAFEKIRKRLLLKHLHM